MSDIMVNSTGPMKTGPNNTYRADVNIAGYLSNDKSTCSFDISEIKDGRMVNRTRYEEKGRTPQALAYLKALGMADQCRASLSIVYYSAR